MADPEDSHFDLAQVLERFPGSAALIRRLVVTDENFWSICEDYALARTALANLEEEASEESGVTRIAEYTALVADLEREIADALRLQTGGEGGDAA